MKCIFCDNRDTDVVETRPSEDGCVIRRRRECGVCQKRFTTYERSEQFPIIVIKRDGRRERFDREKVISGLWKAAEKTSVTQDQINRIVDEVESEIKQEETTEIESKKVGFLVATRLKKIDKVAYIRFASVFQRFVEVEDFEKELKKLL